MNAGDRKSKYPVPKSGAAEALHEVAVTRRPEPLPTESTEQLASPFHRAKQRAFFEEEPNLEQIKILRCMTPEQRWLAAHRLYWTMRHHKAAFLHSQHPAWSEQKIDDEVRHIFSNVRT